MLIRYRASLKEFVGVLVWSPRTAAFSKLSHFRISKSDAEKVHIFHSTAVPLLLMDWTQPHWRSGSFKLWMPSTVDIYTVAAA